MPKDEPALADEAVAAAALESGEEWEDVRVGLGREWEFDKLGPLVGYFAGLERVALEGAERESAEALIFATVDAGEQVFLWNSHELSVAMKSVATGDKVRISFVGRDSFTGPDGPRQIKRYTVQKAVRAA